LFIPCPTGGEPGADKVRPIADQFDIEHAGIIEIQTPAARWKHGRRSGTFPTRTSGGFQLKPQIRHETARKIIRALVSRMLKN
jgi:hypothetical protein